MNRVFLVGFVLWQLFFSNLYAQNANAILGRWIDEKEETIIEISKETDENLYTGKIVWLRDSLDSFNQELRDVLNDNVELRSRKVLGTYMLEDFVWDGTDSWRRGHIYYYHTGNDYNGKIHLSEEGDLRLKGYFSVLFFLGRTQTWKRVADVKSQTRR